MNEVNKKKKIFLIILIFLFSISGICLIYISVKYNILKNNNEEIRKDISEFSKNILDINNDNDSNKLKLDNKKIELKDKIKEYNIWLEMIEKIK